MRWRNVLAACAVLLAARTAHAHPVPFSYLDVRVEQAALDVTLTAHVFDVGHDLQIDPADRLLAPDVLSSHAAALVALMTPRLTLRVDGRLLAPQWSPPEALAERQSVRIRLRYPLSQMPGVVAIDAALFPYDPEHKTFVNVYEGARVTQAILDRAEIHMDYYAGSAQSPWAVVRRFVPAGVHHILIGADHLLFLFGLLLMGGTMRRLAVIVTAFTVAHSLTLSLAALNLVTPPARVIEPAIALSIVYVGLDNLMVRGGRDARAWIAFAFGFIHGFGFANVLRDMDLPARALGWSLFAFNVGVEMGQLVVVVVVASVLALVRRRYPAAGRFVTVAGSLAVSAAGVFWFVERVFFPGGVS